MKTREIMVTGLTVGDTIVDGKAGILVKTITPCTQRGRIHVNTSLCYDTIGTIEIIREDKHSDGRYAVLRHESRRVQGRMVQDDGD